MAKIEGRLLYDRRADRLYVSAHGCRIETLECGDAVELYRDGRWATYTIAGNRQDWHMSEVPGVGAAGLMCARVRVQKEWRPRTLMERIVDRFMRVMSCNSRIHTRR